MDGRPASLTRTVPSPPLFFTFIFLFLLATKLCHLNILWAEEGYGSAAGVQILSGKMLYRDFWFDKPPLAGLVYALWHGEPGFALRFAGTLYGLACCFAAYRAATAIWSRVEGYWAAGLTAFFLVFDVPASVMTIAPDQLMLLPTFAAIDCAARKQSFRAGLWCSVALASNAKALLIIAVCAIWVWPQLMALLAGTLLGCLPWVVWLGAFGALRGYVHQVWWFGAQYSRDTFVVHPLHEATLRTLNWLGFHAALVLPAIALSRKERCWREARWSGWTCAAVIGILAGERFFPRYYFILLPPVLLLAARAMNILEKRWLLATWVLFAIPLIRFGPRYVSLAVDLLRGGEPRWSDILLNQDSRRAAEVINSRKQPGDTLLDWGYRPDLFAYTQLPAEGRFLDSQLLTGVLADRHLKSTHVTFPELAARNRAQLIQERPTWIVDGLGPLNHYLAINSYPELKEWIAANYTVIGNTRASIVYRLNRRTAEGDEHR
jgi:hypothetical protein